jgi:hypothetical protein
MTQQIATFSGGGIQPYMNPEEARTAPCVLAGGASLTQGTVLGLVPGTGTAVNEVQTVTITGTPTGGTFKLMFGDQVSASIAYNAAAAAVQTALAALSNIGTGNVTCGGGALPGTAVTVTFSGTLAGRNVPMLVVVDAALTGGTAPAIAVTETTPGKQAGGYWKAYADANADGSEVARRILKDTVQTNPDGTVRMLGGEVAGGHISAVAYLCGTFLTSELVGLDAAAVADLGRIIAGVPGTLTDPTTVIRIG